MGPVDAAEPDREVRESSLYGRYAQAVDRESAYEKLTAAQEEKAAAEGDRAGAEAASAPRTGGRARAGTKAPEEEPSLVEQVVTSGMFRSLARSVGTQLGREITRSLFGTARQRR
ncbi:helicase HerA-like domain-containing protein [Streptomyces sp. NPDC048297]|uniref:helicase HerA-like domain-containing protein n=1 Tax=Streptomyces sp. NPDC048297 TaxID=3365531 RepID=UPI0037203C0D